MRCSRRGVRGEVPRAHDRAGRVARSGQSGRVPPDAGAGRVAMAERNGVAAAARSRRTSASTSGGRRGCRCLGHSRRHRTPRRDRRDMDSRQCRWPRRQGEAVRAAGRALDGAGVSVHSCNWWWNDEFLERHLEYWRCLEHPVGVSMAGHASGQSNAVMRARGPRIGSCIRAVVDDVAGPRMTHAIPALSSARSERLHASCAVLLVLNLGSRRARRVGSFNLHCS